MMFTQNLENYSFEKMIVFIKHEILGCITLHHFNENTIFTKFRKPPVFENCKTSHFGKKVLIYCTREKP